jgi:hypothetical protein
MGGFCATPRAGHLKHLICICGYLKKHPDQTICFHTGIPDFSHLDHIIYDWAYSVYCHLNGTWNPTRYQTSKYARRLSHGDRRPRIVVQSGDQSSAIKQPITNHQANTDNPNMYSTTNPATTQEADLQSHDHPSTSLQQQSTNILSLNQAHQTLNEVWRTYFTCHMNITIIYPSSKIILRKTSIFPGAQMHMLFPPHTSAYISKICTVSPW